MVSVEGRIRFTSQMKRAFSSKECWPFYLEKLVGDMQGVALFRMNRPEAKNALNRDMQRGFKEVLKATRLDDQLRVVIVKSDVAGTFCSGADLIERRELPLSEMYKFTIGGLVKEMSNLHIPVIAAIDGYALGGGMELALGCDIRIASSSALLGLPETRHGIIPGAGGTQRLCRAVGVCKAKELIFTGRMIGGREAADIRLVNCAVDDNTGGDAAFRKALELAKEILPQGPMALKLAKIAIDKGSGVDLETGLSIEQQCYAQTVQSKDRLEGLDAFREKRKPVYKGE